MIRLSHIFLSLYIEEDSYFMCIYLIDESFFFQLNFFFCASLLWNAILIARNAKLATSNLFFLNVYPTIPQPSSAAAVHSLEKLLQQM